MWNNSSRTSTLRRTQPSPTPLPALLYWKECGEGDGNRALAPVGFLLSSPVVLEVLDDVLPLLLSGGVLRQILAEVILELLGREVLEVPRVGGQILVSDSFRDLLRKGVIQIGRAHV